MTEETKSAEKKPPVQLDVNEDLATVIFNDGFGFSTKVEIAPNGDVTAYLSESDNIQTKLAPTAEDGSATDSLQVSVGKIANTFNAVSVYGVNIESNYGALIVSTNGKVLVKPVLSEVASVKSPDGLTLGQKADDGYIYMGNTADGPLFMAPEDADIMKWSDVKKAIKAAEKQGHTGVRVPSRDDWNQIKKTAKAEEFVAAGTEFTEQPRFARVKRLLLGKDGVKDVVKRADTYWTADECGTAAWSQKTGDRTQKLVMKKEQLSTRLVRN